MSIVLCDYAAQDWQYLISKESYVGERRQCASAEEARAGSSGFAAIVSVGVFNRRDALFGLYVTAGEALFLADGAFHSFGTGLRLRRRALIYPLLSQVTLTQTHDANVRRWTYWHNELLEDGMHTDDFLAYVAECATSNSTLQVFCDRWRR